MVHTEIEASQEGLVERRLHLLSVVVRLSRSAILNTMAYNIPCPSHQLHKRT